MVNKLKVFIFVLFDVVVVVVVVVVSSIWMKISSNVEIDPLCGLHTICVNSQING